MVNLRFLFLFIFGFVVVNCDEAKVCPSGEVKNIETAQQYRGCTQIDGQLLISVQTHCGRDIVRELEDSLSSVEVIEGKLIIYASSALSSLGFFKKLRSVKNNRGDRYGIEVKSNDYLQALFPQNVTIEHGLMLFQYNERLCENIIDKFAYNVPDWQSADCPTCYDTPLFRNGGDFSCRILKPDVVEIKEIKHDSVAIQLTSPKPHDDVGYLVYYSPAPFQDVTQLGLTDKCGDDRWLVIDVPNEIRNATLTTVVKQLQPDTQYAFYIHVYYAEYLSHVGLTKVQYFRTPATTDTSSSETNVPSLTGRKECPPGTISGLVSALRYRGCTHVTGPLVLKSMHPAGLTDAQLEDSLSTIEVIEGSLSIESTNLLSLGFFKKLRLIRNDPIGNDKYGLTLWNNLELLTLFPQNVTIEHGKLYVSYNVKLCVDIVNKLAKNVVDLRNEPNYTADPDTNGPNTACHFRDLNVDIKEVNRDSVIMQLQSLPDHADWQGVRPLFGYWIYYNSAQHQNVTMIYRKDGCGCDGWKVEEFLENKHVTPDQLVLSQLEPDTQYAYYIKINPIDTEYQAGGSTSIKYYRTAP